MTSWICPECGRECSPEEPGCPVCTDGLEALAQPTGIIEIVEELPVTEAHLAESLATEHNSAEATEIYPESPEIEEQPTVTTEPAEPFLTTEQPAIIEVSTESPVIGEESTAITNTLAESPLMEDRFTDSTETHPESHFSEATEIHAKSPVTEEQSTATTSASAESPVVEHQFADGMETRAESQFAEATEIHAESPLTNEQSTATMEIAESSAESPVADEQPAETTETRAESRATENQIAATPEVAPAEIPILEDQFADTVETCAESQFAAASEIHAESPVTEEQSTLTVEAAESSPESPLTDERPADTETRAKPPATGDLFAAAESPVTEEALSDLVEVNPSLTDAPLNSPVDQPAMAAYSPRMDEQLSMQMATVSESPAEAARVVSGATDDLNPSELHILSGAIATSSTAFQSTGGPQSATMARPQLREGRGQLTSLLAFAENSDPYLVISTRNYPLPTNLAHSGSLAIPPLTTPIRIPKPPSPLSPQVPPPEQIASPKGRLSPWVLVVAAAVFLAIASSIYRFATAPETIVPHAAVHVARPIRPPDPDPDAEYPFARFVEVAGLRVVDQNDRPQAQYLVVNHSSTQLNDIGLRIAVRSATATEGAGPLFTLSARVPTLGPHESKEIRTDLDSSIRTGQIPDWVNLRTDVKVIAP